MQRYLARRAIEAWRYAVAALVDDEKAQVLEDGHPLGQRNGLIETIDSGTQPPRLRLVRMKVDGKRLLGA